VNVASFTTSFVFQLFGPSNADGIVGNGITFVIQGNSQTAVGPSGGGLGYGPDHVGGTGGIPNSVAVKFDTIDNQGEGPDSTGLYLNGAAPTIPAVNLSNSPINLRNGDPFRVDLSYDGTTLTETITDTVTAGTFTTKYTVDIPGTVGRNVAYVGFSGGTGGHAAFQDILTWTFGSGTGGPGTGTPAIVPALASNSVATPGTDLSAASAAVATPGGDLTTAAAPGGSAVLLGPGATGSSSSPDWLASNGSAAPSQAQQVFVDSGASLPLGTRVKIKRIDGYLDDLAASLN
jgi:hypothetical protein